MKKYIKQFTKEIIPVVSGILIALFINNWNENRKDKAYINKVYSSIKKDLTETNKKIKENFKKQQTLLDTVNKYIDDDKLTLLEVMVKANGLNFPSIKTNSWKALSNSKIELLDYKKVILLSNIDDGKELLNKKVEYILNFTYNNVKKTEKEKKELLKLYLREIIATEKGLQQEIEKIINE